MGFLREPQGGGGGSQKIPEECIPTLAKGGVSKPWDCAPGPVCLWARDWQAQGFTVLTGRSRTSASLSVAY